MGGGDKVKEVNEYDRKSILSKELLEEVFEEEDEIERSVILASLSVRAKELKVSSEFRQLVSAMKKVTSQLQQETTTHVIRNAMMTDFNIPIGSRYSNMECGSWVANMNGIVSYSIMGMEQRASHQAVLPVERLENVETGEEQIVLAFYIDHRWKEIKVSKEIISSANKIVSLSKYGLSVTSENAKNLVKYLNDVENLNREDINVLKSTSKLGWNDELFIPYDKDIIFDGDARFKQLFEAIKTEGHEDVWLDHVKELRKNARPEIKFLLAASFASALIKPLGCLPFFVDLWGETEGGKTVSLMLASSVWANPSVYIGNYINTDTSFELTANTLNNLPLVLDDSANMNKKVKDDIENIIYRLTAGRGKGRATKDLGMQSITSWRLAILTNGERPLTEFVTQAGAINRIIEIEAGQKIFDNPSATAEVLKANYGFGGKRFIEELKKIPTDKLQEEYRRIVDDLSSDKNMQKQTMSVACVLLADRIVTDAIFKDGCYITMDEARKALVEREELSEGERCYNYLLDKVQMNCSRFDATQNVEKWGFIKDGYVCFYPPALQDRCSEAGYSKKSFLKWAKKKNILLLDDKGNIKPQFVEGKTVRAVGILFNTGVSVDENGFMKLDDDAEIPFD